MSRLLRRLPVLLLASFPFAPCPAAHIDAGTSHACAVVDGGVQCWGDNSSGALGNPSFGESAFALDVVGLEPGTGKGVTSIATARGSSCAVVDGGLLCWGDNFNFQLGNGDADTRLLPTPVSGLAPGSGKNVTAVAVGSYHTCAVESGGVLCWGKNSNGLLGDGTSTTRPTPVPVTGLEPATGKGVVAIAAGVEHTCAAGVFGLKCWGRNRHPVFGADNQSDAPLLISGLPGPISVIDIADRTTCVVSGTLQCWGNGPLGDGTESDSDTPVTVPFLPTPVTAVSIGVAGTQLGDRHTCAIASGNAYCWGRGEYGQIGDGNLSRRLLRQPVQNFDASNGGVATEIAAGEIHTCGLHTAQGLKCWGGVAFGFIGDGSHARELQPAAVAGPAGSGATRLAAAGTHSCAVIASNVWCWGGNRDGELGDGSHTTRYAPVQVPNLGNVTSVSAGTSHSCAVRVGQVWCWGSNISGQLGQDPGVLQQSSAPVQMVGLPPIAQVIGGEGTHTCAITTAGALYCWGNNSYGQTGAANPDGSASSTETWKPHLVLASGVSNASLGPTHTCAVVLGGLACWGLDGAGELGNGPGGGGPSPGEVVGMGPGSGVTMVSAGHFRTCAVINAGAQCWGLDYESTLSGALAFSEVPQPVGLPAGSGVTTISAAISSTCAIVAGSAKCWGFGRLGSLGTGDVLSRDTPAPVSGLSSVSALVTTGYHSCAISSGAVKCWGWTMDGRLGTEAAGTRNLPTAVVSNTLFRSGFE